MRARLQRGGTEPSVTHLSLARVSSFSLAQEGNTPLIYAIQGEQGAVVEMLIAAGADVNLADNVRRAAARSCRARALSLSRPLSLPPLSLSRERERARAVDARGPRASRAARSSRRATSERELPPPLSFRAARVADDFGACGVQDGFTPLHCAAGKGHLEVVQLLLRHRADKELKDNSGSKPVDNVCAYGNKQHEAAITALLR